MSVIEELAQETTMVERFGEIIEASTVDIVELSKSGMSFTRDALIDALDDTGVPQPGDPWDASIAPDLLVVQRTPRVVGLSDTHVKVRVEILYELQRPSADQDFALRGGASLTQIETARDRDGNLITVQHPDATDGEEVTAKATVYAVQGNFEREITMQSADPDAVVSAWINHINDGTFRGAPEGQWLCTNVTYELLDRTTTPKTYRFMFTFERSDRDEGWLYTVAFEDADGRIPPDVVDGVGIKDIEWHAAKDFSELFT